MIMRVRDIRIQEETEEGATYYTLYVDGEGVTCLSYMEADSLHDLLHDEFYVQPCDCEICI